MSLDSILLYAAALVFTVAAFSGVGAYMSWTENRNKGQAGATNWLLLTAVSGYGLTFLLMETRLLLIGDTTTAVRGFVATLVAVGILGLLVIRASRMKR